MSTVNTKYKNYNLKIFIVYSFLLRCFHFRQEFSDHQVGGNHLSNGVALHPVNPNHSPRILIENRTIGLFIRPTDVQRRRRFNGWMASYMAQSSGRALNYSFVVKHSRQDSYVMWKEMIADAPDIRIHTHTHTHRLLYRYTTTFGDCFQYIKEMIL